MVTTLANGKEVPVPQLGMDIDVKLTGNVASSEIRIDYYNPSKDTTLDVSFKFPMDVDTSIYFFEAQYGDEQKFELSVKELEQAETELSECKQRNGACVFARIDEEMHDIIRLNITNLHPQQSCKVTLKTVQRLQVIAPIQGNKDGYLKYKFATSLFSRYKLCPHVDLKHPDCRKIQMMKNSIYGVGRTDMLVHPKLNYKLRNDKTTVFLPGTVSNYQINKNRGRKLNEINQQKCKKSESCQFEFTLQDSSKPYSKDGDIVLYFAIDAKKVNNYKNQVAIEQDDVIMYSHFVSTKTLEDYAKKNNDKNKFHEYIFLIDNSDSMNYQVYGTWGTVMEKGQRMVNAKLALEQILNNLPCSGQVYFNIIKFGCEHSSLYKGGSKKLSGKTKIEAQNYIKKMDANMKCTEILRPIKAATESDRLPMLAENSKKQIFVITDGDVQNHEDVFAYIRAKNDEIRVYSVGIGAGASSALVKGIAREGNGYSAFITETTESAGHFLGAKSLAETVSRSLLAASQTQITNIRFNGNEHESYVDDVLTSGRFITYFTENEQHSDTELTYDITDADGDSRGEKQIIKKSTRYTGDYLHKGALKAIKSKLDLQKMYKVVFQKCRFLLKNINFEVKTFICGHLGAFSTVHSLT